VAEQIRLFDEVGDSAVTAEEFAAELAMIGGDVELHVNSPGGDVFDGLAIYSTLAARPGRVAVVVDGLCASIASVIAMAASPGQLTVAPAGVFMIHEAWALCCGPEADMRKMADRLAGMSEILASVYAGRTGRPAAVWRDAMRAETWYSSDESVTAGLADRVQAPAPAFTDFDAAEMAGLRAAFRLD